jgi:hypothetical protein
MQGVFNSLRRRKEQMRSMEDRVVRLGPHPPDYEKAKDDPFANNNKINDGALLKERKFESNF